MNKLISGDVLKVIKEMPSEYVDCVVTSPPYWGMRNYGDMNQVWGGQKDCQHYWKIKKPYAGQFCQLCGAWLGQLGLEPTPECVTPDTEILTTNGWKIYDKLVLNESVAVYDLSKNEICFSPLIAVGVFNYKGQMVHIKNQGLDILTTPNHRFVVNSIVESKTKKCNRFRLATDLSQNDYVITHAPLKITSRLNIGENFAELLGWIIAEGHYSRAGIIITQSHQANPLYVAQIRNLLTLLGISFRERIRKQEGITNFVIPMLIKKVSTRKREILRKLHNVWIDKIKNLIPRKILTKELVINTSDAEALALFESLMKGDGSKKDKLWSTFVQYNKECMDWFQILALRAGYRATLSNNNRSASLSIKRYWGLTRIINKKSEGINKYLQPYDGIVWCPQVETGAWVARRKGKIFITGNSYVQHLVEIFREVRRVLKKTGTFWLNIGDTYANNGWYPNYFKRKKEEGQKTNFCGLDVDKYGEQKIPAYRGNGIKGKDLCMIPAQLAIALRNDGWWLRDEITWAKGISGISLYRKKGEKYVRFVGSPMPESVKDRCTRASEKIFLLTKSPKYYFDNEAIKEDSIDKESHEGMRFRNTRLMSSIDNVYKEVDDPGTRSIGKKYLKRNKRNVWIVIPETKRKDKKNKEAHFAAYPEKLIEPCILSGCPKNGIVLDPFVGSGTTNLVALKLGRNAIGIDLYAEYIKIAKRRIMKYKITQTKNKIKK